MVFYFQENRRNFKKINFFQTLFKLISNILSGRKKQDVIIHSHFQPTLMFIGITGKKCQQSKRTFHTWNIRGALEIDYEYQQRIRNMENKKEQSLIRRLKRHRDRHAADELIRLYYNEIYGYVFRQLGEKERSMDVTQEIFISMLQSIWNYDSKKAGFRTWLYQIATYKVVDYYRSKSYRSDNLWISLDEVPLEDEWDVEQYVTRQELAEQIFRYLQDKDVTLEKIFRLRFYGEYTFEEIGEILAIPTSTVKTRYYTAQNEIRKEFSK